MNFGYKIIAVDFDGTLCEDKWPEIGEARESLIDYLKSRQTRGDKVILWTCRTGERLQEAVDWCYERRLIFDAINENLPEVIEACGGDSRKIYADEYMDDKMVNPFGYSSTFGLSRGMRAKCHMVDDARMDIDEHGYRHLAESLPMPEMDIVHNGRMAVMDDYMKMRSFGEIDEIHAVDFKFDPAWVAKPNGEVRFTDVALVAARDGINRNGRSLKDLVNDLKIPPIDINWNKSQEISEHK